MILIDTSAWIDFFRGRAPLADKVSELIEANEAAICGPIVTELLRGVRPRQRREEFMELLEGIHAIAEPDDLWVRAGTLGSIAGSRGMSVKSMDLLIATIAIEADVAVLTGDSDFSLLRRAGVPVRLPE